MELIETKDGHDCGVDSGSILHFSDLGPESKFYEKMDPGHFLISKEAGVCLAIS